MKPVVFVGLGGFIGAVSRYLTSLLVSKFTGNGFPWGTIAVNMIGCLILGVLTGIIIDKEFSWPVREFFIIGILGGFTTFSAFGLETYDMLKSGSMNSAAGYVGISLIAGVISVGAGFFVSRQFFSF